MTGRDHYHHGDLRAALLEAGLHQLAAEGQTSVSLRALAKVTGVSPNAPYRHFPDKNALMAALAAEGFRRFANLLEATGVGAPSPIAHLRAQGEACLEFACTQSALYRLMFSPYGYSLQDASCGQESSRAFSLLFGATAAAQGSGWRADHDTSALALSYWAFLHGWAGLLSDKLIPPGIAIPSTFSCLDVFFDGQKA